MGDTGTHLGHGDRVTKNCIGGGNRVGTGRQTTALSDRNRGDKELHWKAVGTGPRVTAPIAHNAAVIPWERLASELDLRLVVTFFLYIFLEKNQILMIDKIVISN